MKTIKLRRHTGIQEHLPVQVREAFPNKQRHTITLKFLIYVHQEIL